MCLCARTALRCEQHTLQNMACRCDGDRSAICMGLLMTGPANIETPLLTTLGSVSFDQGVVRWRDTRLSCVRWSGQRRRLWGGESAVYCSTPCPPLWPAPAPSLPRPPHESSRPKATRGWACTRHESPITARSHENKHTCHVWAEAYLHVYTISPRSRVFPLPMAADKLAPILWVGQ
jgi:hypothetical protein